MIIFLNKNKCIIVGFLNAILKFNSKVYKTKGAEKINSFYLLFL